jgi:hypothetical protein
MRLPSPDYDSFTYHLPGSVLCEMLVSSLTRTLNYNHFSFSFNSAEPGSSVAAFW